MIEHGTLSNAEIIQVLEMYRDSVKSSRKKMAELTPTRERITAIMEFDREVQALEDAMAILRCLPDPDEERGTNADRIRAMTDQELVALLHGICYGRDEPWEQVFKELCCDCCPTVEATGEDGKHYSLHECDFVDGVCPHGDSIRWWLGRQVE